MKRLFTILLMLFPVVGLAQELSLEDCLDAAGSGNFSLKKSSLDILSARAMQAEARWEFAPRASLTSIAYDAIDPLLKITLRDVLGNSDGAWTLNENLTALAYENGITPYYETLSHGYGATITAMQPLYAGGRIINGNRLADLGVEASELKDRIAVRAVKDSIENKYWRIVALQEKQKTLSETSELLGSLEKDLGSAVGAGLATQQNLSQLHLKRGELEAGMHRLDGSLALLKMDLLDYVGYEYKYMDVWQIRLSGTLEELPSPEEVLVEDPQIEAMDEARLLQIQIEAKEREKKMAVGELLPQVAVGASYGYNAMMLPKDGKFNGLIFALVQVPLTDIGKAAARSRRYDYAVRQAEIDRDYLMSRLRLQEAMHRLEVETLWKEIATAQESAEYAEDSFDKTSVRFRAGQATASEVMEASLSVTSAYEVLLQKKIAYLSAVSAYKHSLGTN